MLGGRGKEGGEDYFGQAGRSVRRIPPPTQKLLKLHHHSKVTLQWKKKVCSETPFSLQTFFFTARFCASLQSFGFFTAKSFCSAANFWHFKKGFRLFHCKVSVFSLQGFLVPLQSLQWNQPLCQFLPKASLFLPKASPSISAESLAVYFCRKPLLLSWLLSLIASR